MKKIFIALLLLSANFFITTANAATNDPLPSWNEGPNKKAILDFVKATTEKQSADFVPPEKRIAVFDQDGTLWVEQPMYTQVLFALDRLVEIAPQHPEWKKKEPFKSLITRDRTAVANLSAKDLEKIMAATHTGMSVEAFQVIVKDWLTKNKNTRWNQPFTELVYQPMLEVINLLNANDFDTYIVTGGGQDFVRVYSTETYDIPPYKVIGSATATSYGYEKNGNAVLIKTAKLLLNDNFSGKPEDIYLFTGMRPQAAFGNSTGDQQMLEYTEASKGAHLLMLIRHDDAKREYDYGNDSKIGTFSSKLLSEADQRHWRVVSMKNDWNRIFPFEPEKKTAPP